MKRILKGTERAVFERKEPLTEEEPPPRRKRTKTKKPFVVERQSRWGWEWVQVPGGKAMRNRKEDWTGPWTIHDRYETKKQRDEALKALTKGGFRFSNGEAMYRYRKPENE